MNIGKSTAKTLIKIGAILIILTFVLFNFKVLKSGLGVILNITSPFLLGGLIAMFISVPLQAVEIALRRFIFKDTDNKGLYRGVAFLITIILIIGVGFFVFNSVIPELLKTIIKFAENLVQVFDQFIKWFENVDMGDFSYLEPYQKELTDVVNSLSNTIRAWVSSALKGGISLVTNTLSFLVTLFVAVCFSIYLLFYKETLGKQVTKALHAFLDYDVAETIIISGKRIHRSFSSFLGGTAIEALIFGVLVFIGMTVLRLPYKIPMSVLSAFMTFIPYFGAFLSTFIGFILITAINLQQGIIYLVMSIFLQQFEANIIYPRVVGGQVGLPGIWVLVSVTIGAAVAKLVGMLLAVPVATVIYQTLGDIIEYKTLKKKEGNTGVENPVILSDVMRRSLIYSMANLEEEEEEKEKIELS